MQVALLRDTLRSNADADLLAEAASAKSPVSIEKADAVAGDRSELLAEEKSGVATDTPLSLLLVTSGDVLWIEELEDQLLRQEQLQLITAMARAIRGASVRCAHQFDWPPPQALLLRRRRYGACSRASYTG